MRRRVGAELNCEAARARAVVRGGERGPFIDAGCVAGLGLESLAHSDLLGRVVELAAERSRVEAEYLAAVGELASRDGAQSAAWQLREYTRMNSAQARSEARLAESLAANELGDTLDALAAGEIQVSHAKVIAREAPKTHRRSEDSFPQRNADALCDLILGRQRPVANLVIAADYDFATGQLANPPRRPAEPDRNNRDFRPRPQRTPQPTPVQTA